MSYTATGVEATTTFNVVVERKSVPQPTWKNTAPEYSGSVINVASSTYWNNWDTTAFTYSGCAQTDAGNYTATFTPTTNYRWNGGSTAAIDIGWAIDKAERTLTITPSSIALDANTLSSSATLSYVGDGTVSYSPTGAITGLTIALNGNTITATGDGANAASVTLTVSVSEGTNYLATSAELAISATYWEWGTFGTESNCEEVDAAWFAGLKNYL